jgi:hypothetical protein
MKVQEVLAVEKRQSISENSSMHDIDIPSQEHGSPGSRTSSRQSEEPRPDAPSDLSRKCTANHKNSQETSCEPHYETLARKETKRVNVLRALVLVLLLVATTLTSVGVYRYTSNEEKHNFERLIPWRPPLHPTPLTQSRHSLW